MKEIVLRLVTSSSSKASAAFPGATKQVSSAAIILKLLNGLVSSCAHQLLEVESDLHDILACLSDLDHEQAGELVHVLSPLFRYSPSFTDRCILCIRKATFSNDPACRMSAVSTLVELFRFQVQGLDTGAHRGGAPVGLSIDEIMQLLKRFLQHQSIVRSLLYEKLVALYREFPIVRLVLIRLLHAHLSSYLRTADIDGYTVPGSNDTIIDFGQCLDFHGAVCEPIHELISALVIMVTFKGAEEIPDEEGMQYGCSQTTYFVPQSHDAVASFNTLFSVAVALGSKELDDFDLRDISSGESYSRAALYLDTLQAAVLCIMAIPDSFGDVTIRTENRVEALQALAMRRMRLVEDLDKFRKTREQERKKAKRTAEGDSLLVYIGLDIAAKSGFDDLHSLAKHLQQLDILLMCLRTNDRGEIIVGGLLLSTPYTCDALLDYALRALDSTLSYCTDVHRTQAYLGERCMREYVSFIEAASATCRELLPLLLASFMFLQNVILAEQRDLARAVNILSLAKITRTLLGCIRVEVAACHTRRGLHGTGTSGMDKTSLSDALTKAFDLITGMESRATNSLTPSAHKIQDMFFALFSEDTHPELTASVVPVLVLLVLSEVMQLLDSTSRKQLTVKFTTSLHLMRSVRPPLCAAVIDLLLFICPSNPAERLEKAKEVCKFISDYARVNEVEEGPEKLSLISDETVNTAYESVLVAFERACLEVELLIKYKAGSGKMATILHVNEDELSDDENDERRVGLDVAVMCATLTRLLSALSSLIAINSSDANNERILQLLVRIYKIEVQITKGLVSSRSTWLPDTYKNLLEVTSTEVTPKINKYIVTMMNSTLPKKSKRQAKCVPELTFQMEQLDVQLMKLSAIIMTSDKALVSSYMQKTATRDFKIIGQRDDENDINQSNRTGREKRGR